MKTFILLILISLFPFCIMAQDTIVKRNGEKLIVKIAEVNSDNIRYRKMDYLDGPLFMLQKEDINFIVYGNGSKESYANYTAPVFSKPLLTPIDLTIQTSGKFYYYKERKIGERDMIAIAAKQNDPKINLMIKSVEQKRFIQQATMAGGITLFAGGLFMYAKNRQQRPRRGQKPQPQTNQQKTGQTNGEYLMLGGLTCETISVYFMFNRRKHAHLLADAYNRSLYMR